MSDAHNEVQIYQEKLREASSKCDQLQEEVDSKLKELNEQHETDLKHTRSQLMLEHEVNHIRPNEKYYVFLVTNDLPKTGSVGREIIFFIKNFSILKCTNTYTTLLDQANIPRNNSFVWIL